MRALISAVLLSACVSPTAPPVVTPPQDEGAVERQLAGHLRRVRECLPVGRSGLIDLELTVLPSGRVGGARVTRDTSMLGRVAPCMEQRLGALYFDPPPRRPTRFTHRFTACEVGGDLACELGPATDAEGRRVRPGLAEGLRALHDRREACLAEHPDARAIVDVEIRLDRAGRVSGGWVRRVEPADSPLRECALAPLLGAVVDGVRVPDGASPPAVRATLGVGLGRPTRAHAYAARK